MKKMIGSHKKATNDSLVDSSKDIFEVFLDLSLDNGILKDLPVVGTAIGLLRTGFNIRDYTFVKKLSLFLSSCDEVSDEKRQEYNNRLDEEPGFREKVGEQLILFVEKIDTIDKSILLAKAFSAFLKSEITYKEFLDLGILINALNHSMIKNMCDVLYDASSERFDRLYVNESILETIGVLQRDNLLVYKLKSDYRERKSVFARDNKRIEVQTDTLYKATRLSVLFVRHVVPDVYRLVIDERQLRDGYIKGETEL